MIKPSSVLVYIPCHDGRLHAGCAGGLAAATSAGLLAQFAFLCDMTGPQLVRDMIASSFLASPYEWLVFIDSDIEFSVLDFRLLMNYPHSSEYPHPNPEMAAAATKNADGDDLIVCAEYARKNETMDSVRFGLGFTRIHRSVFEKLDSLSDSTTGAPVLDHFMFQGRMVVDYFLSGVMAHQFCGEDTGFFHLVRMAGITPRIEQRTKLLHTGKKQYPYAMAAEGAN